MWVVRETEEVLESLSLVVTCGATVAGASEAASDDGVDSNSSAIFATITTSERAIAISACRSYAKVVFILASCDELRKWHPLRDCNKASQLWCVR
jgi:hypothetical protein